VTIMTMKKDARVIIDKYFFKSTFDFETNNKIVKKMVIIQVRSYYLKVLISIVELDIGGCEN